MTALLRGIVHWLREPLVHFLAIGALIFLVFHLWGGGGPGSNVIVIRPGQVDAIVARFSRTWLRPPTDQELKGLIDDAVREEMAAREAMAMGLDRDDTIIRRRLRQKLEFLAEDAINATPPTDTELQAWLDQNPDAFRSDPQVSYRQVYLNPEKRGATVRTEAEQLLVQLRSQGPDITTEQLGDASMLPAERPLEPMGEVARSFGREFAEELLKAEPGQWTGPLESAYGLHLVFVREKVDGNLPQLGEIRPIVEREFLAERRKRELNKMYEQMLRSYRVTVEQRAETGGTADAATGTGQGGSK
jgi:parvulin-like peptidyl-prolyl isomerase